jgi:hypothetical protein
VLPVKDPLHAAHATRQKCSALSVCIYVKSTIAATLCEWRQLQMTWHKMNMLSARLDAPVLEGLAETSEAMEKRTGTWCHLTGSWGP